PDQPQDLPQAGLGRHPRLPPIPAGQARQPSGARGHRHTRQAVQECPLPTAAARELMETGTPSLTKVLTMVLFALSCVGLLLFLWLSFGGNIPFNPQGYRFRVSFPHADQLATQADVRIAGVSVGRVVGKSLDPKGNRTIATIEMQNKYAPVRENTRAILRMKTILGETYVELTPGSPRAKPIPDGGLLPRGQVIRAVQLSDIFNAFDPKTRRAFQVWQQELARSVQGNDQNLNNVLGNLPSFAADVTDILRVLDVEHGAVV